MTKHQESHRLLEKVKAAMDDLEVTGTEYREIMEMASADGHIDAAERAILAQFNAMISDGTIKRVAG
jgi:tellurite resistance protein